MIAAKEEDTAKIAKKLAKSVPADCVICLNGDLGAGKTTFARYLIQSIIKDKKLTQEIPSPTFSLLQTYKDKSYLINHYDFYRLENINELIEIDYGNSIAKGICIIEWANKFSEALPQNRIEINFHLIDKIKREINFNFFDSKKIKGLDWCLD